MTNLSRLLEDSARRYPERVALVAGDVRMTYRDLEAAASGVAHLLTTRGVQQGEKIALSCVNHPQFTVVYYGILKAGAVVVPLNVMLKAREIAYHLRDSDARMLFAFEGTADLPVAQYARAALSAAEAHIELVVITDDPQAPSPVEETETLAEAVRSVPKTFVALDVDDDDTAVILYTSGTTGQPKGAELRHRNLRDNALAGRDLFGIDDRAPDTFLCVLPLFHSFGQTNIQNTSIAFGGTVVLLPRFDATRALSVMAEEDVTYFAGVPTMYWGLLAALDSSIDVERIGRRLRVALSGGAPLPLEIHRQFSERFGVSILEGYGLSETSPVASFVRHGQEPRIGTVGTPIPGVEMKLINPDWSDVPSGTEAVGEIAIKGHNVMKGYYGRPEATAEALRDGWFRTGDLGRQDADGYFSIVDRTKDLIIRGGFNVYPRELEEVLMTHPAVSLVAVIGVPHESLGEEVKAVVVRVPGAEITENELVAWGREQFAAYKSPRFVEFRDELPMTSTGKILKRALSG